MTYPDPLSSSQDVFQDSTVEELLMGMASQIAEMEDSVLCSDVRDKLFGPMEFSRRDLGALNIMRGRDNGLPDYNTVRKCFKVGARGICDATIRHGWMSGGLCYCLFGIRQIVQCCPCKTHHVCGLFKLNDEALASLTFS